MHFVNDILKLKSKQFLAIFNELFYFLTVKNLFLTKIKYLKSEKMKWTKENITRKNNDFFLFLFFSQNQKLINHCSLVRLLKWFKVVIIIMLTNVMLNVKLTIWNWLAYCKLQPIITILHSLILHWWAQVQAWLEVTRM